MNVPLQGSCPPHKTLVGFNLGLLSAVELETVAQHLMVCPLCERIVSDMRGSSEDGVVGRVKACLEGPPLDEDTWAALGSRAAGFAAAATLERLTDQHPTARAEEPWVGRSVGRYVILSRIGG